MPNQQSPTKHQWSLFYNHLAHDFGCGKGRKQVDHEKIADLVTNKVAISQLAIDLGRDTNWLRTIFRCHRKAFSYLQHLTVWSAFIPGMSVSEIIKEVKTKEKTSVIAPKSYVQVGAKLCEEKRKRWKILISTMPIKTARSFSGGGALYAWLYRNDRNWLLAFNRVNHSQLVVRKKKVDWRSRDRVLTKQLLSVIERLDSVIEGPRRSQNFLLKQLEDYGTVSKKLNLLPLLSCTLNRYQESIFEFQARRLATTVIKTKQTGEGMNRWQLMRSASLSKERILPIVDSLLDWAVSGSKLK
ncbi:TnsD family Tn7-like transposition protein [Morganella psychrotolerans]|uniref:TnsD family Tn7-like transposition protein n=1 Tax=Morganella psychrotolerans TaxID=368603 RepID=UPI000AF3AC5A|nr:TnsD family Tn7-like transposition protein [Morganella psychrotolerans]